MSSKKNATLIETSNHQVLYSYSTPVAYLDKLEGQLYATTKQWSSTTTKHINEYLSTVKNSGADSVRFVAQSELDTLFGEMSVTRL